ncbi:MAG: beta-galactosidase [Actinomycetaceae bacterium]|nr:beta-galactosidase [Actinomycetaceae bacterium]
MLHLGDALFYGGDYNPDQWPADILEEDIRLMREAGVNLVSLPIFSWATIEPREGEFHFEWLTAILDRLHDAGIRVDLATATASPPAWLSRSYPETLPVDRNGQRLRVGSRQHLVPASPILRAKMRRLVEKLACACGSHPAVAMWHVSNEIGCHVSESFDPVTIKAFRSWLAERYGNIDRLNTAWNTSFWSQRYGSFDEIDAPHLLPTFHNPAQMLDWKRFTSDTLIDLMLIEVDVLRRITPDLPVTTNFMELHPPIDYWKMASHLDVVADDSYPDPADPASPARVAFAGDLARSLGHGRPYLLMEQTTAGVQWRASGNSWKRPGQFRSWSLSRVAHGANGILQFQWRQSPGGAEAMHSAMVPHSGRRSRTWADVVELGDALARLSRHNDGELARSMPSASVAIALDWEAMWAMESMIGPVAVSPHQLLRDWHKTAWEAGHTVDFVPYDADLSGYRVVIVPGPILASQALAASLAQTAREGAAIVITAPCGIYRNDMSAVLSGYHADLSEATGLSVVDLWPATRDNYERWAQVDPSCDRISGSVRTVATDPLQLTTLSGQTLTGGVWAEDIRPERGTDTLATWGPGGAAGDYAGSPAITRHPWKAGTVFYAGTDLAPLGRSWLFAQAQRAGGLGDEPVPPAGVEVIRRGNYRFTINHSDEPVTLATSVVDLATGQRLSQVAVRATIVTYDA